MSNNYRMVEYLASEFYQASWEGISHIVSPGFTFKCPLQNCLGYDDFIKYIKSVFAHLHISEIFITSQDDIHFEVKTILEFLDYEQGIRQETPGSANITILDGKVDSIEIMYDEEFFNLVPA